MTSTRIFFLFLWRLEWWPHKTEPYCCFAPGRSIWLTKFLNGTALSHMNTFTVELGFLLFHTATWVTPDPLSLGLLFPGWRKPFFTSIFFSPYLFNMIQIFLVLRGGKYKILLGFAHREVARNHEKSVKIRQLSLFRENRESMKKKQKSREIARHCPIWFSKFT